MSRASFVQTFSRHRIFLEYSQTSPHEADVSFVGVSFTSTAPRGLICNLAEASGTNTYIPELSSRNTRSSTTIHSRSWPRIMPTNMRGAFWCDRLCRGYKWLEYLEVRLSSAAQLDQPATVKNTQISEMEEVQAQKLGGHPLNRIDLCSLSIGNNCIPL